MEKKAIWIAVAYIIASAAYIIISDSVLAALSDAGNVESVMMLSAAKGTVFVVLTGLIFGLLLNRSLKHSAVWQRRTLDLFQIHPDPMWIYDLQTLQILDVNNAALQLYGYERDEFIGMPIELLRPEEERERLREHLESLTESQSANSGLWRHQTKSGHAIWANIRSSIVETQGKNARLVVATNVSSMMGDWSEKRTIDTDVYQALQRLKIVADSIQDGFVFLNENYEILQVNPTFKNKVGNSNSHLIGRTLLDLTPWLQSRTLVPAFQGIRDTGKSGTTDVLNHELDEWYRLVIYPSSDGYTVFLRDITIEKSAERKLRIEHGRLTTLINNTDSLIFTVDRNRHLTLYNNSFAQIVLESRAYPPILGECPTDLQVFSPLHDTWDAVFDDVVNGATHSCEMLIGAKPSTQRYRLMRMAPLVAEETVVGVGIVMQDVHVLRTSLNQISRSNAMLSDIAQVSSHELRGPLSSIMSLLNLIDLNHLDHEANIEVLRQLRAISTDVDAIVHRIVTMTQALNG